MKDPRTRLAVLVAVAFLQVLVVCWSIYGHEKTLRQGQAFEFDVRPVDPYDPFRGRYVRLALSPSEMPLPSGQFLSHPSEWFYVTLGRGDDGLVTYERISREPPEETDEFLKVHAWQTLALDREEGEEDGERRFVVHVDLPFDRYYLNEDMAPEAERLIWPRRPQDGVEAARGGEEAPRTARLVVRVLRGRGVPETLLIDGRPVEEWVTEAATARPDP